MPQYNDNSLLNLNINDSLGGASELGALIKNLIGKVQTITLVQVASVNATGVNSVGYVDVQPLVSQIDGAGNLYKMPILKNVPYFRLQGGGNAVIIDPQIGDIGLCAFASRDISSVKRNKSVSAPASRRQYDLSDGLYIGGFLNGTPSQYVHFTGSGIVIHSPSQIKLEAPSVIVKSASMVTNTGTYVVNSTATAEFSGGGGVNSDGDIVSKGISVSTHTHSGVISGGDSTGEPN